MTSLHEVSWSCPEAFNVTDLGEFLDKLGWGPFNNEICECSLYTTYKYIYIFIYA